MITLLIAIHCVMKLYFCLIDVVLDVVCQTRCIKSC